MSQTFDFAAVGRLPLPGDNVAIATTRLEAGTKISRNGQTLSLSHTVMEGHRFALAPVAAGQKLLSWELPFGIALRDIAPGDYLCNQGILEALGQRQLDFSLPSKPNFADRIESYILDTATFAPGAQITQNPQPRTFLGYPRPGNRGVGSRNYIVVMGTSSQAASYARLLAERTHPKTLDLPQVDGVVAVAHTEGGGTKAPNNKELLLRTLAGFVVHPNVGAILAVDYGSEAITNGMLRAYMAAHNYPLDSVPHRFLSLQGRFEDQLETGQHQIETWLDPVGATKRGDHPLTHLKLALQCGGSDAFSGVSGNPLAAWAARELIRNGGAANLAETDELIGAEPYVLQNVRDVETAQKFLHMVERFKERAAHHGTSAEGNPSGGNKYRGLYNIVLKSIGAAMKRHPQVRLDYAIDYAEPMAEPGYYFMDSPGNDLESIAGQVAAGCNMIYFVTGNGSITNFPFVPTIKIVTTTQRHTLLAEDMDVNAGAYQDGVPMDQLGSELFERTLNAASGQPTLGERAGHAQVSIWRDWPLEDGQQLEELLAQEAPQTQKLAIQPQDKGPLTSFAAIGNQQQWSTDRIGLVLPTSLCSGQIARMTAERLNQKGLGRDRGISRFVALVHTEGCGVSAGPPEELYARTLLGYLTHPLVGTALLMEHGCERTHNDYMRGALEDLGLDPTHYGWVSVQLDGGIAKVMDRAEALFTAQLAALPAATYGQVGLEQVRIGLLANGPLPSAAAAAFAQLARWVEAAGGTVVVPHNDPLLQEPAFCQALLAGQSTQPTLAHGQRLEQGGFYIMETPTDHWVENLTGLGASGVEVLLAHIGQHPAQGHPMLPLLQVSATPDVHGLYGDDLDLILEGQTAPWANQVLDRLIEVAGRQYTPKLSAQGNNDFQISRGLLGISM